MGEPTPPSPAILIPLKWYAVRSKTWFHIPPQTGCNGYQSRETWYPLTTEDIDDWYSAGGPCVDGNEIYPYMTNDAPILIATHGPFDTRDDCDDWISEQGPG